MMDHFPIQCCHVSPAPLPYERCAILENVQNAQLMLYKQKEDRNQTLRQQKPHFYIKPKTMALILDSSSNVSLVDVIFFISLDDDI